MKNSNQIIIGVVTIIVAGIVVYAFSGIVAYILIAWVLSMVGEPIVTFFQERVGMKKFKIGRSISAAFTLLTLVIIFALLISIFVPLVVEQAQNLSEVNYNNIAETLDEPIRQVNNWMTRLGVEGSSTSPEEQMQKLLSGWFDPAFIGNFFSETITAAGNILIGVFSVFFIAFFFLREQGLFTNMMTAIAPEKYESQISMAIDRMTKMLSRYFSGILVQITIITIFVYVGLSIFGIKNALLIGFFAALINVIPYLGPMLGAFFAVFVTISSNLDLDFYSEMIPMLSKVVAVFASMQLLDNFVLQPFIFSNSVMAHPLEVFIVILIGNEINGPIGMILAIPVYTALRIIARTFLREIRLVRKITDKMDQAV
ncbi:MAG: AI-2E family transporter [Bacteroidia bacterium]|nr:AI-2E family transporter [Bacteroidia bacterium]